MFRPPRIDQRIGVRRLAVQRARDRERGLGQPLLRPGDPAVKGTGSPAASRRAQVGGRRVKLGAEARRRSARRASSGPFDLRQHLRIGDRRRAGSAAAAGLGRAREHLGRDEIPRPAPAPAPCGTGRRPPALVRRSPRRRPRWRRFIRPGRRRPGAREPVAAAGSVRPARVEAGRAASPVPARQRVRRPAPGSRAGCSGASAISWSASVFASAMSPARHARPRRSAIELEVFADRGTAPGEVLRRRR